MLTRCDCWFWFSSTTAVWLICKLIIDSFSLIVLLIHYGSKTHLWHHIKTNEYALLVSRVLNQHQFQGRDNFSLLYCTDINHCIENSCLNGGLCRNIANEYKCTWVDGFLFGCYRHKSDDVKDTWCLFCCYPSSKNDIARFCRNTTMLSDMQMLFLF